MLLSKVICPQCGGTVEVDETFDTAKCPFCCSSFIIDKPRGFKHKTKEAWRTKVIDVPPNAVKNELDIYSVFGWDFKHRKTYKVYDGQRYFKNGSVRDKYKDVVQLTLQRNVLADWCTEELLLKERDFFELRDEYIKKDEEFENKYFFGKRSPVLSKIYIPFSFIPTVFLLLMLPTTIFLLISLFLISFCAEKGNPLAYLFMFTSFLSFIAIPLEFLLSVATFCLIILFVFLEYKKKKRIIDLAFKQEEIAHQEDQLERLNKMNAIARWAGEQMEKKFGYKLEPNLVES